MALGRRAGAAVPRSQRRQMMLDGAEGGDDRAAWVQNSGTELRACC